MHLCASYMSVQVLQRSEDTGYPGTGTGGSEPPGVVLGTEPGPSRRAVSSLNCRDIPQPQMTILIEWHWQPSHMTVLLKVVSLCPQGWGQEPVRKLPIELLGCLLCFSHQKSLVSPVSLAWWITESNSGHWSSVRCCSTYEHLAIPGDIFIFHDSVLWVSQYRKYGVQKLVVAWYRAQSLGRGVLKNAWTICSSESCL